MYLSTDKYNPSLQNSAHYTILHDSPSSSSSSLKAKYNQLLRIEEELGENRARYAGAGFRLPGWMG